MIFIEESPKGLIPPSHEVYLGSGVAAQPQPWSLQPEQHQQVVQAIVQNPTIASHLHAAMKSGTDPALVTLPGNSDTIMVPKDQWPASRQTSVTTMTTHNAPISSGTGTPQKMAAAAATSATGSTAIASTSHTSQYQFAVKPPPGIHDTSANAEWEQEEQQRWVREQIARDAKLLSNVAKVLGTDFVHISSTTHDCW